MKQPTVFYVEDDDMMIEIVGEFLAEEGFQVIPEKRPCLALNSISCKEYDFVLLDVNVPPLKMTDFKQLLDKLGVHYAFCSASPEHYPGLPVWSKSEICKYASRIKKILQIG